jgi:DNA-3-methyladenine glycosylase
MLPNKFFGRSSILVAKELLGKTLCRKLKNSKIIKLKIIETEAYEGFNDLASHASRGLTKRNAPMFEGPGTIYVYLTYGMHWMLNIVCGPVGHPSAVLIRGVEEIEKGKIAQRKILNGPGKLTKYLGIDKSLNNEKLGKASGLWVEESKEKNIKPASPAGGLKIINSPRIGVSYAGEIWANKKWRFVLKKTERTSKLR